MKKEIHLIIKKLGLELKRIIKYDRRHFVAVCQLKTKEVLLKINTSGRVNQKLLSEIIILKKLKNVFKDKFVPHYFTSSSPKSSPIFLLREYVKGCTTGNLFGFNSAKFNQKDLKEITIFLKKKGKMNKNNIKIRNKNWYVKNFILYKKDWGKLITRDRLKEILVFYKKSQNLINKNLVVNHGDLFPHNIIKKNKEIYIIDWGEVIVENKFWDIITVWLNLWQKPKWQKILIKEFIKNQSSHQVADFFVLYLSYQTGAIVKCCQHRKENLPYLKESKQLIKYCLNNINLIINNKFKF